MDRESLWILRYRLGATSARGVKLWVMLAMSVSSNTYFEGKAQVLPLICAQE